MNKSNKSYLPGYQLNYDKIGFMVSQWFILFVQSHLFPTLDKSTVTFLYFFCSAAKLSCICNIFIVIDIFVLQEIYFTTITGNISYYRKFCIVCISSISVTIIFLFCLSHHITSHHYLIFKFGYLYC